jgi:hypothetical protein
MAKVRASSTLLAICFACLGAGPLRAATLLPVGPNFQVNTYTTHEQRGAAVAMASSGAFIVAWEGFGQQGGGDFQLFGQRFASSGAAQGPEFQINQYTTTSTQTNVSVAMASNGSFVAVWQSFGGQDGYEVGTFARRFDASGAPLAAEFQVNTYTAGLEGNPAIAVDGDGDFVIVWDSYAQDGSFGGVFGQRFASSGARIGGEFQVTAYTLGAQYFPAVGAAGDGNFVVVWSDKSRDGDGYGVFGRLWSPMGPAGPDFQVNTHTVDNQFVYDAKMGDDGTFVVSWAGQRGASAYDAFARRFDSDSTPLTPEILVNAYTTQAQSRPVIALGSGGSFVVVWDSRYQDGDLLGVFARAFDGGGSPLGGEQQISTETMWDQSNPAIASDRSGRFVVAWQDGSSNYGRDGSYRGVFAQRLALNATLDVDGDGSTEPLTDGLLVLRFLFGFTGPTLTSGAVGAGCTRCTPGEIEMYLAGLS